MIDRAWGVIHNKHKKHEMTPAPPPPEDPCSQESLLFNPIGQDLERRRFWVVDGACTSISAPSQRSTLFVCICPPIWSYWNICSAYCGLSSWFRPCMRGSPCRSPFIASPRVYMSTNPWKVTSAFQSISSTQEEYLAWLDVLKAKEPSEPKAGARRTKLELNHIALIKLAEERIPAIEAELAVSLVYVNVTLVGWPRPSCVLREGSYTQSFHVAYSTCEKEDSST